MVRQYRYAIKDYTWEIPAGSVNENESLIDAAVALGMTRDMAEKLALQTVSGTSKLMSDQNISAVELKTMVTSPGGTTAEALMTLEKQQFRTALMEAVYSAYKKSISLRGES